MNRLYSSPLHLFLLCLLLFTRPITTQAQTESESPPTEASSPIPLVHTVGEGENLTYIADLYNTTPDALQRLNNLSESDFLFVGQQLIVPGGEGEAIATLYTVQIGDTLPAIAAFFNTNITNIAEANRLINPYYTPSMGQSFTIISRTGSPLPQAQTGIPHIVQSGDTLLTLAAQYNITPQAIMAANELPYPAYLHNGQRLRLPSDQPYRDLPGEWVDVQLRPFPIIPGNTVAVYVENLLDGQPSGELADQPLRFVTEGDGYTALIGLDAFTDPGTYTLTLAGSGNRPWRPFRQQIEITPGAYTTQFITLSEAFNPLLDPAVRQNEDAFLEPLFSQFSDIQRWQGPFQLPITTTAVTAGYGDGRSYNGGPVEIFHTGVDFGGAVGTPVTAPADGVVVFNGTTELRGNIIILDHGRGVMTAYFHLSESFVQAGTTVSTGQRIGALGSTGLSSGPHLHWDLRIMNVPVNALQWTTETFP